MQDPQGRRRAAREQCLEGGLTDHQQCTLPQCTYRGRSWSLLEERHFAEELPRLVHREKDVLAALTLGNLELAVEDDIERVPRIAFLQHALPSGDGDRLGHLIQLLQVLFREVGEEGDLA